MKKKAHSSDSESDASFDDVPRKKSKKEENEGGLKFTKNADGVEMIDLGDRKYAAVKTFKNNSFVVVREYYTKGSDVLLPGRKGITLKPDQWAVLKKAITKLDDWL